MYKSNEKTPNLIPQRTNTQTTNTEQKLQKMAILLEALCLKTKL